MQYRAEIDGLRAIAVLSVILFHAGVAAVPGGFVGVDVFFVISGYLITNILLADLERGRFSLRRFYERRARRILPALFFMLLCCLPLAWLWLVPPQLKDFSQAVVAVIFMASNLFFWREASYFETSSDENLLLHTWSLAVEEQFYVFFPFILLAVWSLGRRRAAFIGVALISLASLTLCEWLSRVSPSGNFYLMPTRAWELGAGALVAMLPPFSKQSWNSAVSGIGFGLVIGSIVVLDKSVPFPSVATLPPVLGAALVILYGRADTPVANMLSAPACVGMGVISYSAYLWHQPLFALARVRSLEEPDVLLLGLIPVTLACAYLSWRYVEQPFRKAGSVQSLSLRRHGPWVGVPAAIMAVGLLGHFTHGWLRGWQADHPLEASAITYLRYDSTQEARQQFFEGGCFFTDSLEDFEARTCLSFSSGQQNYLLLGDSHAAHFSKALRELYRKQHLLQATAAGCRPLHGRTDAGDCFTLYRGVFEFIAAERDRIKGIILSANWREAEISDLASTLTHLLDLGIPVVVFGPTAQYANAFPILLARMPKEDSAKPSNRLGLKQFWDLDRKMDEAMQEIGVDYVPIIKLLCPGGNCRNYARRGEPMHFDYGHFTLPGARALIHDGLPADINSLFLRSRQTLLRQADRGARTDS